MNPEGRLSPALLLFSSGTFFMCYLAMVTLGVLTPTVSRELGLSAAESLWILNAYFLTLATFTAPAGRLGDMYGHRRLLLAGLALVAVGNAIAALAPGFAILVAGLAIAGIGGAALMPSTIAIVANAVPPEKVGQAFGKTVTLGLTSFMIGPLMTGALTTSFGWRQALAVNAALAGVFIVVGWRGVPPSVKKGGSFDAMGSLLVGSAAGLALVAILQLAAEDRFSLPILAMAAASAVLVAVYARYSERAANPVLDLRLLRNPVFRGSTVALMAAQFSINAYAVYIALYLQHVIGLSAMMAGVGMLAAYTLPPVLSMAAGSYTDRFGARPVATVGTVFLLLAGVLAILFADRAAYPWILPSLLAMGVASTLTLTSLVVASSAALPPEKRGQGGGLQVTLRWLAAALGVSVVGVLVHTVGLAEGHPHHLSVAGYVAGFALISAAAALSLALIRAKLPR